MKPFPWPIVLLVCAISISVFNPAWLLLKLGYAYKTGALYHLQQFDSTWLTLYLAVQAWLLLMVSYASVLFWGQKIHAIAVSKAVFFLLFLFFTVEIAAVYSQSRDYAPLMQLVLMEIQFNAVMLAVNMLFVAYIMHSQRVHVLVSSTAKVNYYGLIRSFVHLFNAHLFGVNFYALFGFIGVALLLWMARDLLVAQEMAAPNEMVLFLIIAVLKGVFFLLLVHLARRNWYLPVVWGVMNTLLELFYAYMLSGSVVTQWALMLSFFLQGGLFMLFLIAGIRYFGANLISLAVTAAMALPLAVLLSQQLDYVLQGSEHFVPRLLPMAMAAIEGLLLGIIIYLSTYLYFQRWQDSTLRTRIESRQLFSNS